MMKKTLAGAFALGVLGLVAPGCDENDVGALVESALATHRPDAEERIETEEKLVGYEECGVNDKLGFYRTSNAVPACHAQIVDCDSASSGTLAGCELTSSHIGDTLTFKGAVAGGLASGSINVRFEYKHALSRSKKIHLEAAETPQGKAEAGDYISAEAVGNFSVKTYVSGEIDGVKVINFDASNFFSYDKKNVRWCATAQVPERSCEPKSYMMIRRCTEDGVASSCVPTEGGTEGETSCALAAEVTPVPDCSGCGDHECNPETESALSCPVDCEG